MPLQHAERFNFFPASPFCCVTSVFVGDLHLIEQEEEMERPWTGARIPDLAFSGAQLKPMTSWSPGETYVIVVAFYPDALVEMTGVDLSPFTGCVAAAERALPRQVLEPCRRFFEAARREEIDEGFSHLEAEFGAMWVSMRPAARSTKRIKDWKKSLVRRAALVGSGHSTRQIARRVRSWTGVSERDLQGLGHTEEFYVRLHEAIGKGNVDWASLAAASGFADQPHMIKQVRRHTGFTPDQLRRHARDDETFWGYRLLGRYFDKTQGQ
ncbi:MAG: AraC family transcriptional regulator [Bradyrhizobiaceae bacterium]|nr:AraC family transcriptional regulator [Bradyrhizobiaceae bacterium]